jgi:hypothetical protein
VLCFEINNVLTAQKAYPLLYTSSSQAAVFGAAPQCECVAKVRSLRAQVVKLL